MSGRIETFTSDAESSKWSKNKDINVVEAGVDIGDGTSGGGSNVEVDQVVTEGREVAGITVDGERTPILIPNAGEWTQSDWAESDPSDDAYIKNKPNLANVATSGDYTDLSNTPDLSDFVEDANYVHTDYNYDLGAKTVVDGVSDALAGKVDKVQGKTLSDNNYSNADKTKLGNLANVYGIGTNLTLDPQTNILSADAQPITIDSAMSTTSENAVQNKVITAALDDKVDKVQGKVLSDNNYTTAEKDKLAGIDNGAEVNDISTISVNGTNVPADQNKNVNIIVPVNTLYADSPIGTIFSFGGTTVPNGFLLCDGSAVSRTTYAELFAVIGTAFGPGDGSTTFNIPDLRGEFIRGAGTNRHANQGNGGTVGAHQDATYQPSIMASGDKIACLDSDLDGDNNSVREQDRFVTRTPSGIISGQTQSITKFQVSGSRGTTSSTEIGFYARPTNTSVNFIIKAERAAVPIDIEDYVDDEIDSAFATLATVATSGDYTDLSNTPSLATVATSGDYDDLSNKPANLTSAQINALIALLN